MRTTLLIRIISIVALLLSLLAWSGSMVDAKPKREHRCYEKDGKRICYDKHTQETNKGSYQEYNEETHIKTDNDGTDKRSKVHFKKNSWPKKKARQGKWPKMKPRLKKYFKKRFWKF